MSLYAAETLEKLREEENRWRDETLHPLTDRYPERRGEFITTSSKPIRRLYTPLDDAGLDYMRDLGYPGEYPFTRGVHPTMHRGRLWTMRMFAGFGHGRVFGDRIIGLVKVLQVLDAPQDAHQKLDQLRLGLTLRTCPFVNAANAIGIESGFLRPPSAICGDGCNRTS